MHKKSIMAMVGLLAFSSSTLALDALSVYDGKSEVPCQQTTLDGTIDLLSVMEYAICNNPSLKSSYLATQTASAEYGQALSSYFPTINGSADLSHSESKIDGGDSSNASDTSAGLSLNWLLLDLGGRGATTDQFRAYLQSSYYGYDNTLQNLLFSVAQAYYAVLSAEEKYEGLTESEKSYKKSFEEAKSRFDLGLVPLSDKLQAQTAYEQARLASNVARKNIALRRGDLAVLLNMPPQTNFKLARPKKDLKKEKQENIEKLVETALKNRPDYLALEQRREASLLEIKKVKSSGLPTLSATASAGVGDNLKSGDDTRYSSSVGLRLSVPIFTGFSQSYKEGQAEFSYQKTLKDLEQSKNDIQNEVWSAVQDYETYFESYKISKTLLESAKESERVAFASYKVGKVNILTLLDAQAQLATARIENSTAFYNVLTAQNNILRVLGKMEKQH